MQIKELISEQQPIGTVGTTAGMAQPIGQTPTVSQNPATNGAPVSAVTPQSQAAILAQQRKERDQQKKTVADQIKALQQQLQTLQKQQQELSRG